MTKIVKIALITAGLALVSMPAAAYEKGDWLVRVGGGMVEPKSDNSDIVSVDSGASLIFNGEYFLSPTLGFEVLAALPFSHDVHDLDGNKIAETKHLPPTFSLNYHFATDGGFKPYLGAGLNYTLFFDEEIEGATLNLDGSFGLAVQVGADIDLSDNMFVNVAVRWIDINTDASIPEIPVEFEVEIDPIVYSLALGWRF